MSAPGRRRRAWRRCSSAAGPTACRSSRPRRSGSRRCSAAATRQRLPRPRPARDGRGDAGTGGRLRRPGRLPPGLLPGGGRRRRGRPRPRVQPARPGGDHPARRAARGGQRPGRGTHRPEQRHGRARPGLPGEPHHRPGAAAARQPDRRGDARRLDRATLGHMGKVGFCVAEDEEASPWEPLHVERGFAAGQSVVTRHRQRRAAVHLRPPQPHPRGPRLHTRLGGGQRLEHELVAAGGAVGVRDLPRARADVPRRRLDQAAAAPIHVRGGAQARRRAAPRRDDPGRPRGRTRRRRCPSGHRRRRSCCSWPVARPGVTLQSSAPAPAWDPRSSPGRWSRRGR